MSSVLAFATQGDRSLDQRRLDALLALVADEVSHFAFDNKRKLISALRLLRVIRSDRPSLVVMEGTGVAGGVTVLLTRALLRVRYVVISGDGNAAA
jgi:hypothetical protein